MQRMLIAAAILAIFVYGLTAPMLGALLPTYHLSGDQSGTLGLVQALGLVVASLTAGPVIDLRGKKPALLTGLALVAAAMFWAPNAGSYATLLFVFFLFGFGGGIVVTGANALAGDVNESHRASTLNFLNLFFGLGGIITPFISGILTPTQLCYVVAGLAVLVLLVNVMAAMPTPPGASAFRFDEAVALLGRPQLLLLSLFLFLYVACEVGVWNWLKTYLVSPAVGIGPTTASNIVGFGFALGLLVGRLITSRILIRVPALTVTLVAALLMAVTTFAMLRVTTPGALSVAVFCAGLAMAPMFPTTLGMVADTFRRGTASAMGIAITFGWLGLAVSSPFIGYLSGPSKENVRNALLLIPVFSVGMVLVNLVLRPLVRPPAGMLPSDAKVS